MKPLSILAFALAGFALLFGLSAALAWFEMRCRRAWREFKAAARS